MDLQLGVGQIGMTAGEPERLGHLLDGLLDCRACRGTRTCSGRCRRRPAAPAPPRARSRPARPRRSASQPFGTTIIRSATSGYRSACQPRSASFTNRRGRLVQHPLLPGPGGMALGERRARRGTGPASTSRGSPARTARRSAGGTARPRRTTRTGCRWPATTSKRLRRAACSAVPTAARPTRSSAPGTASSGCTGTRFDQQRDGAAQPAEPAQVLLPGVLVQRRPLHLDPRVDRLRAAPRPPSRSLVEEVQRSGEHRHVPALRDEVVGRRPGPVHAAGPRGREVERQVEHAWAPRATSVHRVLLPRGRRVVRAVPGRCRAAIRSLDRARRPSSGTNAGSRGPASAAAPHRHGQRVGDHEQLEPGPRAAPRGRSTGPPPAAQRAHDSPVDPARRPGARTPARPAAFGSRSRPRPASRAAAPGSGTSTPAPSAPAGMRRQLPRSTSPAPRIEILPPRLRGRPGPPRSAGGDHRARTPRPPPAGGCPRAPGTAPPLRCRREPAAAAGTPAARARAPITGTPDRRSAVVRPGRPPRSRSGRPAPRGRTPGRARPGTAPAAAGSRPRSSPDRRRRRPARPAASSIPASVRSGPPQRVTSTGMPAASASTTAMPNVSVPAGVHQQIVFAHQAQRLSGGTEPVKVTASATPSAAARARSGPQRAVADQRQPSAPGPRRGTSRTPPAAGRRPCRVSAPTKSQRRSSVTGSARGCVEGDRVGRSAPILSACCGNASSSRPRTPSPTAKKPGTAQHLVVHARGPRAGRAPAGGSWRARSRTPGVGCGVVAAPPSRWAGRRGRAPPAASSGPPCSAAARASSWRRAIAAWPRPRGTGTGR